MADLRGKNADETVPDIATWGTGNVLETGEGVVKVDLDDKASLSDVTQSGSNEHGRWLKIYTSENAGIMHVWIDIETSSTSRSAATFTSPQQFSVFDINNAYKDVACSLGGGIVVASPSSGNVQGDRNITEFGVGYRTDQNAFRVYYESSGTSLSGDRVMILTIHAIGPFDDG